MNKNSILLPVSILLAGVLIAGSIIYSKVPKNAKPLTKSELIAILEDDDFILGSEDAPVSLVIFGDYQCPYCKLQYDQTEKKIIENYVNTGKVKMFYRDLPLRNIHPQAQLAAQATQCAGNQGKFWEYHDYLFDNQEAIPELDFTVTAVTLGLSENEFQKCLESNETKLEVDTDAQHAFNYGLDATPMSLVNGTLVEGSQPYEVFVQVIENELANPVE
ncbi:MAG: hypothetical protein COU06_01620 [Candidatus Harrisonbacteria bacterium CG10_big_fil_rev_8_21_14_0_10_38_8]|uniref:Thioredoxin domain-containing protein n=1 Tax=Candidatus Harrisonbacteria bacterium CG10_big_fil_rev_8_21_14_0_10_38_8 TaxID=1974582 RepID=A0A2M6WK11_9BACT|nr:MAG: hypothetical protein COU06_01620 [Candidatus Harrisonbacteria bacterium CG10_big_fil_rev_8_21_14_0_10_38_8]